MEKASASLEAVFKHLNAILRYVASGYVAFVVAMLLFDKDTFGLKDTLIASLPRWLTATIFPAVTGVLIYAVHANVLGRMFWFIIVAVRYMFKLLPTPPNKEDFYNVLGNYSQKRGDGFGWLTVPLPIFLTRFLVFYTGLQIDLEIRRLAQKSHIKGLQQARDSWAALINLLYCASYPLILIPLAVEDALPHDRLAGYIKYIGCITFIAALASDFRIAGRDIWITAWHMDATMKKKLFGESREGSTCTTLTSIPKVKSSS